MGIWGAQADSLEEKANLESLLRLQLRRCCPKDESKGQSARAPRLATARAGALASQSRSGAGQEAGMTGRGRKGRVALAWRLCASVTAAVACVALCCFELAARAEELEGAFVGWGGEVRML